MSNDYEDDFLSPEVEEREVCNEDANLTYVLIPNFSDDPGGFTLERTSFSEDEPTIIRISGILTKTSSTWGTGCKIWIKNGRRHRESGPAVIYANGAEIWYLNGVIHRGDDKPAVNHDDLKEWWVDGFRHRDGNKPAVISRNYKEWWINGKRVGYE